MTVRPQVSQRQEVVVRDLIEVIKERDLTQEGAVLRDCQTRTQYGVPLNVIYRSEDHLAFRVCYTVKRFISLPKMKNFIL